MKTHTTETARRKIDPVLPDQGGRSRPVDPPAVHSVREETIRQKAYEFYEKRGKRQGHALDDWLDAEAYLSTRAALTAAPKAENAMATDPVCGMEVYENTAAGTALYQGVVYYFCSRACLGVFEDNPAAYAAMAS